MIVELRDIRIEGERLRATQHGATAADWLIVGPDDTATLDVRFCVQTHDGAVIYVHAGGRADAKTFGRGGATFLAPVFETGDERYAWLNKVQTIAKGSGAPRTRRSSCHGRPPSTRRPDRGRSGGRGSPVPRHPSSLTHSWLRCDAQNQRHRLQSAVEVLVKSTLQGL